VAIQYRRRRRRKIRSRYPGHSRRHAGVRLRMGPRPHSRVDIKLNPEIVAPPIKQDGERALGVTRVPRVAAPDQIKMGAGAKPARRHLPATRYRSTSRAQVFVTERGPHFAAAAPYIHSIEDLPRNSSMTGKTATQARSRPSWVRNRRRYGGAGVARPSRPRHDFPGPDGGSVRAVVVDQARRKPWELGLAETQPDPGAEPPE